MGVAGLNVWLRTHFGSCFTHHRWATGQTESKDEWSRVEGVGVDLGGELHHLCQQSAGTHELFFFQRLHERLDAILLRLRPLRSAVLAVDGPGIQIRVAEDALTAFVGPLIEQPRRASCQVGRTETPTYEGTAKREAV